MNDIKFDIFYSSQKRSIHFSVFFLFPSYDFAQQIGTFLPNLNLGQRWAKIIFKLQHLKLSRLTWDIWQKFGCGYKQTWSWFCSIHVMDELGLSRVAKIIMSRSQRLDKANCDFEDFIIVPLYIEPMSLCSMITC